MNASAKANDQQDRQQEEKVNQYGCHKQQDSAAVRIAALSSAFRRLHTVVSSDQEAQRCTLSELQAKRSTTECPSGYDDREKMYNMDVYLPRSSSHYGGALPLSSYLQNECVLLRSHPIWRNQKYVLPSNLIVFNKVAQLLDERNEASKEETEH